MKETIISAIHELAENIEGIEYKIKNANFGYGTVYADLSLWCEERRVAKHDIELLEVMLSNYNLNN